MNLQVGVKLVIVNKDGAILMLKRSGYENLNDTWDIPGGRIDPTEPLLEALRREVREEIGATFRGTPTLLAAQDIFVTAKNLHVVRLTYRLQEDIELGELGDEHSEARYVSPDQIDTLSVDPYLLELIDDSNS